MPAEQTPVVLAGQSGGSVALSLVGGLCLFALVLAAAWFCTRWIGGYYRRGGGDTGSLRVLERTVIGPDRTLMVVRAGEQVWLIGVTPHHISLIGELDPAAYPKTAPDQGPVPATKDFSAVLRSAAAGWSRGKKEGQADGSGREGSSGDSTGSGRGGGRDE